jgi:hypothetical protein
MAVDLRNIPPVGRANALRWLTLAGRASRDAGPGTDKTKDHKPGFKVPQLGLCDGSKWSFRGKLRP